MDLTHCARRDASGPSRARPRKGCQGAACSNWTSCNRCDRDLSARTASQARERRREGCALSQCARTAAVADGRVEDPEEVCEAGRHQEAGLSPYTASLICYTFVGGRRGSESGAGDARSRRHLDHADLHPRRPGVSALGSQAVSPASVMDGCFSFSITTTLSLTTWSSTSASWENCRLSSEMTRSASMRSERWGSTAL